MKFSSLFNVSAGESDSPEENVFVSINEFVSVLKSRDRQDKVIVSNVRRTFQNYSGGIKTVNGQQVIPVASVLRYCFHYADSQDACKLVTKIVQRELLSQKGIESVGSSFELYKLIAKTHFHNTEFPFLNVVFDEQRIETLVVEHKPCFTQEEWIKICWFENHFSKSESALPDQFEDLIALKYSKFQSILSFRDCSEKLLKVSNKEIRVKTKRFTQADDIGRVQICAAKHHYPHILDSDLLDLLQQYCEDNILSVISFDTLDSKEKNYIQLVIEVTTLDLNYDVSDLCKRSYYYILRKHNVHIESVYFCNEECLKPFLSGQNRARFHLRDEIEINNLDGILHKWHNEEDFEDNTTDTTDASPCESCSFSSSNITPLGLKGFDVFHEWYVETPIEIQLLLEVFINNRSLKKASDKLSFLSHKLEKLLRLYDNLLNVYNRNFIGIFQQANTNELLVEYKSVNSVFDITSTAGTTTSLSYAESNLKKQADEDLCYYKTYLKQHYLQYEAITACPKRFICLRDCHVILMLDNLVRIRSTDEPNRGFFFRSKQLCTLPITLQGLPTDSVITSQWHLPDCDGSDNCLCKNPENLKKTDITRTLLQLNPKEKLKHLQFFRLMTWSNSTLWNKLTDEILEHVDNDSITKEYTEFNQIQETAEKDLVEDREEPTEDVDLVDILSDLNVQPTAENEIELESENLMTDETYVICESIVDDDSEDQYRENVADNVQDEELIELERSIDQMTIIDSDSVADSTPNIQHLLSSFGFSKFKVPSLLCRHPPPAVGRDDDIYITKQILDDILKKMGYLADNTKSVNRILCGPDNKIGKSILTLMSADHKYNAFLVEFPLLHLRKSKITILFSAYHDAGIIEILKFMRDDNQDDWKRLVSVQHIDIATKYVRRIAISLHIAFLIVFTKSLAADEQELFWNDMEMGEASAVADSWAMRFEDFLDSGSKVNATFALHLDMMRHCDHVVEIAFAERLGGPDGYDLVLAAVKESLRFSFVNNATSYAPYCVQLLHQHYSAGFFHQCLKSTLYSTPFKDSNRNFACDTKRELDHIDALKGFRSGSNLTAVTSRMSLMDTLNEVRDYRSSDKNKHSDPDCLGWGITEVDQEHIFPTVALILRQGGLSLVDNAVPCNVYTKTPILLPSSILDDYSNSTGEYLLLRYIVREKMFNTVPADIPAQEDISGPSELIARAKRSKGVTIKRTVKSKISTAKSECQLKEEKRQKLVAKESRLIDCFTSSHNACQAIVKPDSTKPKVMKAIGMQRALKTLVDMCRTDSNTEYANKLILLNQSHIPHVVSPESTVCIVEFAGVKFKLGNLHTGNEYIQHVETIIKGFLQQFPNLNTVVICEEKYTFTPDDFKAGTREQRKSKDQKSVDHLKTASDIINENSLKKEAITKTIQGKMAISTYLAQNLNKIQIKQECKIIVDSEFHLHICKCQHPCNCQQYATPLICSVIKTDDKFSSRIECLHNIRQRKGEAEMAVVDWLIEFKDQMKAGECIISIISSGDIDAVPIHIYAVSQYWNRDAESNFIVPVYVLLQKPRGRWDIYNITGLTRLFETRFQDKTVGAKIALGLCIGGNDYVPKFHQVSHEKVLTVIVSNPTLRNNLFEFGDNIILNPEYLAELFRCIYCPKRYQNANLSYQNVRALTIAKTEDKSSQGGYRTNDPRKWLPPLSAIARLGELVQLQIKYMETVGKHDAVNPDFLQYSCLKKNASNEIEYDFGPDSHFASFDELPAITISGATAKKRQLDSTPQKGLRRKRPLTSTPKSKS